MWNIKEVGSQSGTMALAEAFRRGVGELRCDFYCHAMRVLTRLKKYSNLTQIPRHNRSFQSFEFQVFNMTFFRTIFFRTVQVGSPRTALEPLCTTRESAQLLIWLYFFSSSSAKTKPKSKEVCSHSVCTREIVVIWRKKTLNNNKHATLVVTSAETQPSPRVLRFFRDFSSP